MSRTRHKHYAPKQFAEKRSERQKALTRELTKGKTPKALRRAARASRWDVER